jgi:hypothetical protein
MVLRVKAAEEKEGGAPGGSCFLAANGRVLVASRFRSGPLHYRLLEGIDRCARCGIGEGAADTRMLVRAHRLVRGVVLSTDVERTSGFLEVPDSSTLTVGRGLEVQVSPILP